MAMEPEPLDFTKLRYVLYARKSTTDETRQVRSINDQVSDCKKLASDLGINLVKILRETQSAKKPGIRPIFRGMINDIKKGVYDGILAWNPDRLARNMLEGGEIIDLIDQNIIKDLKFKTHFFTKDANGKMLLGMAFVLSKQYSDDLSQKVTRGVRSRFGEGKTSVPKHGYTNEGGIYKPDGRNFDLICEAWKMRLQNKSIEDIANYLNSEGYSKTIKRSGKKVDMDMRILSRIFHDPFYYGVLIQAEQKVDLRLLFSDFKPAASEEDFFTIQGFTYHKIRPSKPHRNVFYPLRGMMICDYCGGNMVVGPSTSESGEKLLYYRCDNKDCEWKKNKEIKPRSLRAKVVFEFIYSFLKGGLNLTEKEYNKYYRGLSKITDEMRQKTQTDLHIKQGLIKRVDEERKDRSLKIIDFKKDDQIYQTNLNKINELLEQSNQLNGEIEKIQNKLRRPEEDQMTIEQFLNLSKNAELLVKAADFIQKDAISRLIFLNFTVNEVKVTNFRLKEPFATLLKSRQLLSGRGAEN